MKTLAGFLLLSAAASSPATGAGSGEWLQAQQWQRRLVLAVEVDEPPLRAEAEPLREALIERRMSIWRLDGVTPVWIAGAAPPQDAGALVADAASLRDRLGLVDPGLYLIGLDGGVKAQRAHADQLIELVEAVDSMPMRVQEMRASANGTDP